MFTGIVQNLAPVTSVAASGRSTALRVATSFQDLEPGESIAINGVCLTVTEYDREGEALFFVSPETLDKTSLGQLRAGHRVNLERAVTLATRLSGHLVQGHVDGLGKIAAIAPEAEGSTRVAFELPADLARYCVPKGSIAINGVSLTINHLERASTSARVEVTLIPHTWTHTQFCDARVGDAVNIEVDVLAKYVESLTWGRAAQGVQL